MKQNGTSKNEVRTEFFKNLGISKSLITLPSIGLGCVKEFAKQGVTTDRSHQQWVERNQDSFHKLAKIAGNRKTITVHRGDIEDYVPNRPVDLLNADLESGFTRRFGIALETRLAPCLMEDAKALLWFTWSRNAQSSDFYKHFVGICDRSNPGLLCDLKNKISKELSTRDHRTITYLVMLRCALNRYSFHIRRAQHYQDGMGMIAIRIENIRKSFDAPVYPSFTSIAAGFENKRIRANYASNELLIINQKLATVGMDIKYTETGYDLYQDGVIAEHLNGLASIQRLVDRL